MSARLKPYRDHMGALLGYSFACPGCSGPDEERHYIPTEPGHGKAWGFNGSLERPTFTPSILVYETRWSDGSVGIKRCHSFVIDGRIQFLADCGHALAGQTVDLPEVEP